MEVRTQRVMKSEGFILPHLSAEDYGLLFFLAPPCAPRTALQRRACGPAGSPRRVTSSLGHLVNGLLRNELKERINQPRMLRATIENLYQSRALKHLSPHSRGEMLCEYGSDRAQVGRC